MAQKKLQKDSTHNALDLDGDGIISDQELASSEALTRHEKADAQRRMAWVAMMSMIVFTLAVFLPIFPDARIKALSDLFGLFYIGQAGVVGAYMGRRVRLWRVLLLHGHPAAHPDTNRKHSKAGNSKAATGRYDQYHD